MSHNISFNVNYNGKTGNDISLFTACSMVTTNACTAGLTQDLRIHIPVISYSTIFGTAYLWSDLQYIDVGDGNIWLRVTSGGQENTANGSNCQAATYNQSSGLLHVPDIIFRDAANQSSLWADFQYIPTSDNLTRLKLTNYGLK